MGLYTSGSRLRLSSAEEQVGLEQVEESQEGNPDARKQRGQKEHDMVLGQWGTRAGKAGEWKEIRLHRMELYYVSSRKFSLLKRIFHRMRMESSN